MAVDMFIEIKGAEGETTDAKFKSKKAIDVLAWSWGLANTVNMTAGSGAGAGKAAFQDLSFTHYFDAASPFLAIFCCKGQHIDEVTLTVRKSGGEKLEYIIIKMKKVFISSISTGGSGGEDKLTENVSLAFGAVKVDYQPQNDKGGKEGAVKTFAWSVSKNNDKFEV